jgi:hypothetical protein
MDIWSILWPFGQFYDIYFVGIWYIFPVLDKKSGNHVPLEMQALASRFVSARVTDFGRNVACWAIVSFGQFFKVALFVFLSSLHGIK